MLKFLLVEESKDKIQYKYFPEGGSEYGVVSFDMKTRNGSVETLAKADKHQTYALKMLKRIRKMVDNNTFEKNGIVAWY